MFNKPVRNTLLRHAIQVLSPWVAGIIGAVALLMGVVFSG